MIIIRLFLSVKVNDGCSLSVKFNKLRKGGCRLRSINKISVGQVQYGYIRSRSIVRIRANEISATFLMKKVAKKCAKSYTPGVSDTLLTVND